MDDYEQAKKSAEELQASIQNCKEGMEKIKFQILGSLVAALVIGLLGFVVKLAWIFPPIILGTCAGRLRLRRTFSKRMNDSEVALSRTNTVLRLCEIRARAQNMD